MDKLMNQKVFAETIVQYVKRALPEELVETNVRALELDLWADKLHMVLLLTRPWNNTTTGFVLDKWYQNYLNKTMTVETAAAAIINDRRLYAMPSASTTPNTFLQEGFAIIYV